MSEEIKFKKEDVDILEEQIKQLKQENEAYKLSEQEAKEIIAELEYKNKKLNTQNAGLQATLREWDRFNKYRKALKEIREAIIENVPKKQGDYNFSKSLNPDKYALLEYIQNKIDEALND